MTRPRIPAAPNAIQKGTPLKLLLDVEALECLAHNISLGYKAFNSAAFLRNARDRLRQGGLMERGHAIAKSLREHLPDNYAKAVDILLASLTPPLTTTEDNGLGGFFYLPHTLFIAKYGIDPDGNDGKDPFEISMKAQYELTRRFSSEFSIRPFLIHQQERTLHRLLEWMTDPDPHVRRLCTEGTRPRLPWAVRIPAFIADPRLVLPILERLKDDPSLYVRRSVANHLGDLAKDHPELVYDLCNRWLKRSSSELNWVIRHALRYPAKKGDKTALKLRSMAR